MRFMCQILLVGSIAMLLAGCEPKVAERGKLELAETAAKITPNVTTKAEIMQMLGTPSSTSQFGESAWYYVSTRKEGFAFFAPDVVQQHVVRLTFNENTVASVESYTGDDAEPIDFIARETPTEGQSYGFFEQLLGNIGKFNKQRDSAAP